MLGFRPEDAVFEPSPKGAEDAFRAEVYAAEPMGTSTIITLKSVGMFKVIAPRDLRVKIGDAGNLRILSERAHIFDAETKERLV